MHPIPGSHYKLYFILKFIFFSSVNFWDLVGRKNKIRSRALILSNLGPAARQERTGMDIGVY